MGLSQLVNLVTLDKVIGHSVYVNEMREDIFYHTQKTVSCQILEDTGWWYGNIIDHNTYYDFYFRIYIKFCLIISTNHSKLYNWFI